MKKNNLPAKYYKESLLILVQNHLLLLNKEKVKKLRIINNFLKVLLDSNKTKKIEYLKIYIYIKKNIFLSLFF
jgi:hypothetical protein